MSLVIQGPTGARLVLRKGWQPMDADAAAYISAVEAADTAAGQTGGLEEKTKIAIDNFVLGCKADGIWTAIKASCILAGARTLNGALVPLAGTAPTNYNFVAGDYNRKTGLVGNGSTKYLDSNRNNNADPQNSNHNAVYATTVGTVSATQNRAFMAGGITNQAGTNFLAQAISTGNLFTRSRSSAVTDSGAAVAAGFVGASRSSSTGYTTRANKASYTVSVASDGLLNQIVLVYTRSVGIGLSDGYSDARISFYSIGESLDLTLLDARVTDLMTALGAAIP